MTLPANLPYLSGDLLEGLGITAAEVVACIEDLLVHREKRQVWAPPKSAVVTADGRYMMATLAAADDPPYMAVKSLLLNPRNSGNGQPGINAIVTLLDSETGLPLAIIDGNWVTAIRTAGLSAVAAKRLARPNSATIAFIGCGVQARNHLQIFNQLFPLRDVRAFARTATSREALCGVAETLGLTATPALDAKNAIGDADIVISSVTYAQNLDPFVSVENLKPGAFASITDLAVPWHQNGMSSFDRIVIDDLAQEAVMSNPLVARELIHGDLSSLVNGGTAGRTDENQRTAFIFRGLAVGDLALAALAYRKAILG